MGVWIKETMFKSVLIKIKSIQRYSELYVRFRQHYSALANMRQFQFYTIFNLIYLKKHKITQLLG